MKKNTGLVLLQCAIAGSVVINAHATVSQSSSPGMSPMATASPRQSLEQWFESNAHLPDACRPDVCSEMVTVDLKGTFQWPLTQAGDNATIACPHGGIRSSGDVAHRSCLLTRAGGNYFSSWDQPLTEACNWESEITRLMFELKEDLRDAYSKKNHDSALRTIGEIRRLMGETQSVTEVDIEVCADVFEMTLGEMASSPATAMQDIGEEMVQTVSLISEVKIDVLEIAAESCDRITSTLQQYMERIRFVADQTSFNVTTDNIQVNVNRLTLSREPGPGKELDNRHEFVSRASKESEKVMFSIPIPQPLSFRTNLEVIEDRVVFIVYLANSLFAVQPIVSDDNGTDFSGNAVSSIVAFSSIQINGKAVTELSESIEVTFAREPSAMDDLDSIMCGVDPIDSQSQIAETGGGCFAANISESSTTCLCNVLGNYYILSEDLEYADNVQLDFEADFTFMGFQQVEALSIYSIIGFCVSILGLVVTIGTYLAFKNLRRGRPTLILLNLCVALLFQMVSFLALAPFAKIQDGCRVANILRVYLILVSLMWNGVEGLNMYLSLIQVFTAYISHFVLKCGIIAWSVPAVIVVFPLFFDVTSYDGFHSTEARCAFLCQLPANTLYFVLLLPMSLIVLCNTIVFAMVVNILRRQTKPGTGRSNHSNTMEQLRGAVAMLVLLGLAWVFSGFAVINYNNVGSDLQVMQVVFQCLFVTCIAFQGFYIFLFHCARNVDVRRHWSSVVSGTSISRATRGSSSTSSCKTGTTNRTVSEQDSVPMSLNFTKA